MILAAALLLFASCSDDGDNGTTPGDSTADGLDYLSGDLPDVAEQPETATPETSQPQDVPEKPDTVIPRPDAEPADVLIPDEKSPDLSSPEDTAQPDEYVDTYVEPVACISDDDCADFEMVCEPVSELCVQCMFDIDCVADQHCVEWKCKSVVSCSDSNDCADSPGKPVCDPATAECVECAADEDCGENEECADYACLPFLPCLSTKDCPGDDICWQEKGKCVDCIEDADCEELQTCGPKNVCVQLFECESDKQCTSMNMVCDSEAGICKECLQHTDCPAAYHCVFEKCIVDACKTGGQLCVENGIMECNEVGDGFEPVEQCLEAQSCVQEWPEAHCEDWACTPGPAYCLEGAEVVIDCSPDGLSIVDETDCTLDGFWCMNGQCLEQICEPDTTGCAEDGLQLAFCVDKGTGYLLEPCPEGTYCQPNEEAGKANCVVQFCKPDLPACNGDLATVCNYNGSDVLQGGIDCAEDGLECNNGACVECEEFEVCDGVDNDCDGQVDNSPEDCAAPDLCFNGGCFSPPNKQKCTILAFGGHLYTLCKNFNVNYQSAQDVCAAWNESTLMVINSQEEQDFLVSKSSKACWIGYDDIAVEDEWTWAACCSEYSFWCSNEPNNWGDGEDCGAANYKTFGADNGCWNDYKCSQNLSDFMCEIQ